MDLFSKRQAATRLKNRSVFLNPVGPKRGMLVKVGECGTPPSDAGLPEKWLLSGYFLRFERCDGSAEESIWHARFDIAIPSTFCHHDRRLLADLKQLSTRVVQLPVAGRPMEAVLWSLHVTWKRRPCGSKVSRPWTTHRDWGQTVFVYVFSGAAEAVLSGPEDLLFLREI